MLSMQFHVELSGLPKGFWISAAASSDQNSLKSRARLVLLTLHLRGEQEPSHTGALRDG